MKHKGGCHCGNIRVVFESEIDPWEIKVRACQCSFCRKHGARAISDPCGLLTIEVDDSERLARYMFAHHTAEFFLCRACGVYVAAATVDTDQRRAIAQLNVLADHNLFVNEPVPVDYTEETPPERIERRRQVWMPVSIKIPEFEPNG